ncbi:helix-turn-helix domain-containing protein [Nocardioides marmoriginsengisoli]|uniref:helix-turn-helix domain-containing protein n=1 Tax=Nocardioides marmoriginsengisoli TaxID=661483 RepID=UPI0011CE01DB|nr:helix-turn-helix domain-containing protein [Nocardioides marmoriginsengisoli]
MATTTDSEARYADLLDRLREVSGFAENLARRVQAEVGPFTGPVDGRRNRLIRMATEGAVRLFFDVAAGREHTSRRVDDLFAKMGHGEATDEHDLSPMLAALDLAAQMSWDLVRSLAVEHAASAAALDRLGEAIDTVFARLTEQVKRGHQTALHQLARKPHRRRHDLAEALLTGTDPYLASIAAEWTVPTTVVVLALEVTPAGTDEVPPWRDSPELLVCSTGLSDPGPMLVTTPEHLAAALDLLDQDRSVTRIATSWPVNLASTPAASLWTRRAIDLARRGVIPTARVIECLRHRTQLWLHAEPYMRQQLCQELLAPLLAETPNSREILSETLLTWLETRDSAPAIAARLDVHPQTVRYRWKRINEIFGEALHDPELVVQLTMLLKASVPLWKAGDQSDFERFHTEGEE